MKGQFKNLVIGERKGAAIWVKRKLKEARKKKKHELPETNVYVLYTM